MGKNYTAIIKKGSEGWYVGQIKEVPEVVSQGKTVEQLESNLIDALKLFLNEALPSDWSLRNIFLND